MTFFYGVSLLVLAAVIGGLLIYFLTRYQRSPAIFYYRLFVFAMLVWVVMGGVGLVTPFSQWIDFVNRMSHIAGIFIMTFFVFFSLAFPYLKSFLYSTTKTLLWVFYGTNIVFVLMILFTELIVKKIDHWLAPVNGPLYMIYTVYVLGLWVWGYTQLIRRLSEAQDYQRRLIKVLLIGIGLTSMLALPAAFIPPILGVGWSTLLIWLPYFSSIFWLGSTIWILARH